MISKEQSAQCLLVTYVKDVATDMIDNYSNGNIKASAEAYREMNSISVKLFWRHISPEQKIQIENILDEAGIER